MRKHNTVTMQYESECCFPERIQKLSFKYTLLAVIMGSILRTGTLRKCKMLLWSTITIRTKAGEVGSNKRIAKWMGTTIRYNC